MTPSLRRRSALTGLVAAYFVSVAGTAMSALAIPWLVLTTTGSAGRTGLVVFAEMTPYVVLQAASGPWVDRLGARRTSIWGNAVATVLVGAIPALHVADALTFEVLIGCVALAGATRGLADCSNTALVPRVADHSGVPLERATGLASGASQAGMLIGAPLAGAVVAISDPFTVVLVDAVTFAVAACLVAALVPPSPRESPGEAQTVEAPQGDETAGYFAQLAEGFRFVRADRLLLALVGMIAMTNLLDYALFAVLLPTWVRLHLGGAEALGLILAASGVGSLLGNLAGAALGPRLPRRRAYAVGFLVGGAPLFVVLGLSTVLWPPLVMAFVAGLSTGAINPILGAVAYERIPVTLVARVMGVVKASAWLGIPFGPLLGGALADVVGLDPTLLMFGAVFFAVTLLPFLWPVFGEMDRRRAAEARVEPGV